MLKNAATDSIVLAVDHFNRAVGPARLEASLIFAQRALELLLKAVIYERTGSIREPGRAYSYSFKKCLNIGVDQLQVVGSDERIALQAARRRPRLSHSPSDPTGRTAALHQDPERGGHFRGAVTPILRGELVGLSPGSRFACISSAACHIRRGPRRRTHCDHGASRTQPPPERGSEGSPTRVAQPRSSRVG
jgi:hypothetical protein